MGVMRVHPAPRGQNISWRYGADASFSAAEAIIGRQRKLRRLPHIFSKVLELPFRSDADVPVAEDPDCFRFVVSASGGFGVGGGGSVRAEAIQICPGVMKVVLRESDAVAGYGWQEELELDRWRFRLPPSTRPELATAEYANGELVVIVPKAPALDDYGGEEEDVEGLGGGELMNSDVNRLVLVQ